MQTPFLTRALLGSAAAILVSFAAGGCDQFDPVKTESLCENRNLVSMRCPQCQEQPYAAECSVCQTDSTHCRETDSNPGTDPDSGKSGDGARTDGSVEGGSGAESGSGGSSGMGVGGAGRGAANGGNGGMSGAGGGAGGPAQSPFCMDDLWCSSRYPSTPACDVQNRSCVQCVRNTDCTGMLKFCNTSFHLCANCGSNADCPGRTCDTMNMVCVDCGQDSDCKDPKNNNCDTRTHTCVDCVRNAGCTDEAVNKTCDASMICVDCLEDGDCSEMGKPACDKPNRTCVGCTVNQHCNVAPNLTCDTTKQICVDCRDDTGCSGATPRCNMDAQKCVACLDPSDCASGHCVEQACVECEEDGDCGDADASHCDPDTNKCVGCTSSTQCGHLSATRACDTTSRSCVECNDDTTCAGKACLRATHECSDVNVGALGVCTACQADSMCMTNMKCIGMSFSGSGYGNYCAFTQSSRSQGRCASARPYTGISTVRSVDGSNQTYCVPPSSTSCPAVIDAVKPPGGKTCTGDAVCGLGRNDGNCNADQRCTYGCLDDVDCPTGATCLAGLSCGVE